jgi:hypothetical protein
MKRWEGIGRGATLRGPRVKKEVAFQLRAAHELNDPLTYRPWLSLKARTSGKEEMKIKGRMKKRLRCRP